MEKTHLLLTSPSFYDLYFHCSYTSIDSYCREELEKQKSHERYMQRQEQGKTEQARKDLGETLFCT